MGWKKDVLAQNPISSADNRQACDRNGRSADSEFAVGRNSLNISKFSIGRHFCVHLSFFSLANAEKDQKIRQKEMATQPLFNVDDRDFHICRLLGLLPSQTEAEILL